MNRLNSRLDTPEERNSELEDKPELKQPQRIMKREVSFKNTDPEGSGGEGRGRGGWDGEYM